jgi:hypothetical protein
LKAKARRCMNDDSVSRDSCIFLIDVAPTKPCIHWLPIELLIQQVFLLIINDLPERYILIWTILFNVAPLDPGLNY